MGCLDELTFINQNNNNNCTIPNPQRCTDSNTRINFHREYGIAAASLGFVASLSILLLLFVLGTDGYWFAAPSFSCCRGFSSSCSIKIISAIIFFALTLFSCGIGLYLATKPLAVFLRKFPLEMQLATTVSPSYSSADPPVLAPHFATKNMFLTFTSESADYHLGETIQFNDVGCKNALLRNSQVSLIGFISMPEAAADDSSLPPLQRSLIMMMSCFGLCAFFAIVLVVLSLSNSKGTIMNVLLWKENDDNEEVEDEKELLDAKEMINSGVENEDETGLLGGENDNQATRKKKESTKVDETPTEFIRSSVVQETEKKETRRFMENLRRDKQRQNQEEQQYYHHSGSRSRLRRSREHNENDSAVANLPRLTFSEEEDSEKCQRMMDFNRGPLSKDEIERLREYIRKHHPEDLEQFEKEVDLYEKHRHKTLSEQREYEKMISERRQQRLIRHSNNNNNNHYFSDSVSSPSLSQNRNSANRQQIRRNNFHDSFSSPSIQRNNLQVDPRNLKPQTMSPSPPEKYFCIDPFVMENMRNKMRQEILEQQNGGTFDFFVQDDYNGEQAGDLVISEQDDDESLQHEF